MSVPARLRRRAPLVLTALVAVAIAAPLGAYASHQFTDVPDSNPFHTDIDALADSGVTTGCGGTNYCPDDFVTREQMAAFMNRLGALSASKTPVVNADKLDGLDSLDFLPSAAITMTQFAGWEASSATVARSNSNVDIGRATAGGTTLYLGLNSPEAIGGFGYALESVTVCFAANANVTITGMSVYKISGTTTVATIGDAADTVLTVDTCRTLTDSTPDPSGAFSWHLTIPTSWAAGGTLEVGSIRTTWVVTTAVG